MQKATRLLCLSALVVSVACAKKSPPPQAEPQPQPASTEAQPTASSEPAAAPAAETKSEPAAAATPAETKAAEPAAKSETPPAETKTEPAKTDTPPAAEAAAKPDWCPAAPLKKKCEAAAKKGKTGCVTIYTKLSAKDAKGKLVVKDDTGAPLKKAPKLKCAYKQKEAPDMCCAVFDNLPKGKAFTFEVGTTAIGGGTAE